MKNKKLMSRLLAVICALGLGGALQATDYYWIGGASGNWDAAANWSLSEGGAAAYAYPGSAGDYYTTPTDTATISTESTITIPTSRSVYVLSMTLSAEVTLSGGVLYTESVSGAGTLRMNGLSISSYVLGKNDADTTQVTIANPVEICAGTVNHFISPQRSANTYGGHITLNGALTGSGELDFDIAGSGNNQYRGIYFKGDVSGFTGVFKDTGAVYGDTRFFAAAAKGEGASWTVHCWNRNTYGYFLGADVSGSIALGALNGSIGAGSKSGITFTIGARNEDCAFDGALGTKNYLVKTGTADLVYSGGSFLGLELQDGTFTVEATTTLPTSYIKFAGGTLRYGTDAAADCSTLVKNSTGAISVDTAGYEISWANASLQANNTSAKGITKKGEGTLKLTSDANTAVGLFTSAAYTNRVEAGTLSVKNYCGGQTVINSKILGTGTFTIASGKTNKGFRINDNGALSEFEGTVEWAQEVDASSNAIMWLPNVGLSGSHDLDLSKLRWRVTGNPATAVEIGRSEMTSGKTYTFGAFDHLYPNALIRVNNAVNFVIAGTHGESYLNGAFVSNAVYFVKTGPGALTIGSGFSAPAGSTLTVDDGNTGTVSLDPQACATLPIKIAAGKWVYFKDGNTTVATVSGADGTVTVNTQVPISLPSITCASGTSTIIKKGAGTLTLTSSYVGAVDVREGTLVLPDADLKQNAAGELYLGSEDNSVTIGEGALLVAKKCQLYPGATLDLKGGSLTVNTGTQTIITNDVSSITNSADTLSVVTVGMNGGTPDWNNRAILGGNLRYVLTGSKLVHFADSTSSIVNTHTGGTVISNLTAQTRFYGQEDFGSGPIVLYGPTKLQIPSQTLRTLTFANDIAIYGEGNDLKVEGLSGGSQVYFTGAWTGDGELLLWNGFKPNIFFHGDMSGFAGTLHCKYSGDNYVHFGANALTHGMAKMSLVLTNDTATANNRIYIDSTEDNQVVNFGTLATATADQKAYPSASTWIQNSVSRSITIAAGERNEDVTFAAIIKDQSTAFPTSFEKRGTGTLTFTNPDMAYTGTTAVNGGRLVIAFASWAYSPITVGDGATLQAETTFSDTATVTVKEGGTITGTLNCLAGLTMEDGSILETNAVVTGTVDLSKVIIVTPDPGPLNRMTYAEKKTHTEVLAWVSDPTGTARYLTDLNLNETMGRWSIRTVASKTHPGFYDIELYCSTKGLFSYIK